MFAVRGPHRDAARILGRAYLFLAGKDDGSFDFWLRQSFDYNDVRRAEQRVSTNLATLLELGSLAVSVKDGTIDLNIDAGGILEIVRRLLRTSGSSVAVIASCGKSQYSILRSVRDLTAHSLDIRPITCCNCSTTQQVAAVRVTCIRRWKLVSLTVCVDHLLKLLPVQF